MASLSEGFGAKLDSWPSDRLTTIINSAQIVLWACLAMTQLPAHGHFTFDQAYFYEMAVRVAEAWRPPAYGPFVSGTNPVVLTPGGLLFVVMSVPFFFGIRDPQLGMAWIIILSSIGFALLDRALVRLKAENTLRLALIAILTWSLWHARFTDVFWNANVFLFASPAFFYVTVRLITDEKPKPIWGVLLGLLAALEMQIHASGTLAIAGCGVLWLTLNPRSVRPKPLGLAVLGFALGFLPYVWVEARDGWPNTNMLKGALPGGVDPVAWYRSLGAYVLYPSHAQTRDALDRFENGPWHDRIFALSLVATLAWTAVGLFVRYKGKWASLVFLLLLPPYFRITGRAYYDHYVITGLVFYALPCAAGIAYALSNHKWRWVAVTYLVVFAASGTALLFGGQQVIRPGDPWNGRSVSWQLEQTKLNLAAGPQPSGYDDQFGFSRWVMARRVLNRPLLFRVGPYLCDIDFKLPGIEPPLAQRVPPGKGVIELTGNVWFVCGPP